MNITYIQIKKALQRFGLMEWAKSVSLSEAVEKPEFIKAMESLVEESK